MTIEELQTKYLEVVGRLTGSDDRRYLVWKIREAEKGRIPVGPRKTRARDGEPLEVKSLPLRLEADVADKMAEAWRAKGIKNRMEFFRGTRRPLPRASRRARRGRALHEHGRHGRVNAAESEGLRQAYKRLRRPFSAEPRGYSQRLKTHAKSTCSALFEARTEACMSSRDGHWAPPRTRGRRR